VNPVRTRLRSSARPLLFPCVLLALAVFATPSECAIPGSASGVVTVSIILDAKGAALAGIQADIQFESNTFSVRSCSLNLLLSISRLRRM
jgi:hypothetical protein